MGGVFGDCWSRASERGIDCSVKKRVSLKEEGWRMIFYIQRIMGMICY